MKISDVSRILFIAGLCLQASRTMAAGAAELRSASLSDQGSIQPSSSASSVGDFGTAMALLGGSGEEMNSRGVTPVQGAHISHPGFEIVSPIGYPGGYQAWQEMAQRLSKECPGCM